MHWQVRHTTQSGAITTDDYYGDAWDATRHHQSLVAHPDTQRVETWLMDSRPILASAWDVADASRSSVLYAQSCGRSA